MLAVRLQVERAEGQRKLMEAQDLMTKYQGENEELKLRAKRLRASLAAQGHATDSVGGLGDRQSPACFPIGSASAPPPPTTSSPETLEGRQGSLSQDCKEEPTSSAEDNTAYNDVCTDTYNNSTGSDHTAPTTTTTATTTTIASSQGTPSCYEGGKASLVEEALAEEEPFNSSDFMSYYLG